MKSLRLILGDQLNHFISSFQHVDPDSNVILMVGVRNEITIIYRNLERMGTERRRQLACDAGKFFDTIAEESA